MQDATVVPLTSSDKEVSRPSGRVSFLLLILVALVAAFVVRLPDLGQRPLHCDEAVHAIKFGALLERNAYRYDPTEYHGPTLNYLTLPVAWLRGAHSLVRMDDASLRIVPVIFGAALVLLLPLVRDGLGRSASLVAALLICLSPAMVYYSRYYIQEILLVFFSLLTIASGWRYSQTLTTSTGNASSKGLRWAILTGAGIGLMFATKETCVISWFAMAVGLALVMGRNVLELRRVPLSHIAAAVIAAFVVAAVFFSSFGSNPGGIIDSIRTYTYYFSRSGGQGHQKPWFYYLKLLSWNHQGGFVWSEAAILVLAAIGAVSALVSKHDQRRPLAVFLIGYTISTAIFYALIPYKTPWIAMNFLLPAILLAGLGAEALVRESARWRLGWVAAAVIALAVYNLGVQMYRGSYRFYADERNPYAYVPTSTDLMRFVNNIHDAAAENPIGKATVIKIMSEEYWPLPWYLRDFPSIGYWNDIPNDPEASVMIVSPELAEKLEPRLKGKYTKVMAGLRPGVILLGYLRQDLWEAMLTKRDLAMKKKTDSVVR